MSNIYFDVPGGPCRIGWTVQVMQLIDIMSFAHWGEDPETGECLAERLLEGQEGTILYLEYFCRCGQTYPEDPMIGVGLVVNGKYIIEEFWFEELDFGHPNKQLTQGERHEHHDTTGT